MSTGDFPVCTCGRTTSGGALGCPVHDPSRNGVWRSKPEYLQTQDEQADAEMARLHAEAMRQKERADANLAELWMPYCGVPKRRAS